MKNKKQSEKSQPVTPQINPLPASTPLTEAVREQMHMMTEAVAKLKAFAAMSTALIERPDADALPLSDDEKLGYYFIGSDICGEFTDIKNDIEKAYRTTIGARGIAK